MTRGSKYGRDRESRASRRVRLLRDINTMRLVGYRNGHVTERQSLALHEKKLRDLDIADGYNRTWWAVHGNLEDMKPKRPGEPSRSASQGAYR
jgi:hypothetical protein